MKGFVKWLKRYLIHRRVSVCLACRWAHEHPEIHDVCDQCGVVTCVAHPSQRGN